MSIAKQIVVMLIALMCGGFATVAQQSGTSLTKIFTSVDEAITFAYPEGWVVQQLPQSDTIRLANSEEAFLHYQGQSDQLLIDLTIDTIGAFPMPPDSEPASNPRELIEAHRQPFAATTDVFEVSDVEEFTLGSYPGATYRILGNFTLAYYAIALTDQTTAFLMVSTTEDKLDDTQDIAFDIVQTIELSPAVTVAPAALPHSGALPLTETYVAPDDSVAFDHPEAWQVAYMPTMLEGILPIIMLGSTPTVLSKNPGSDGLQPDEVQVQIIAGDKTLLLRPMVEIESDDTPTEILQAFLALNPKPFDVEVVDTSMCDRPAARVDIVIGELHSVGLVIDYSDGQAVFFSASVSVETTEQWGSTLYAIAESIRFTSEPQPCET